MWPEPLHPAIVHFPIVLTLLLPLVMLAAYLLGRRRVAVRTAWIGVVVVAGLLTASSWVAVRTGASQEERVEEVVPEAALETHEERAETFLLGSAAVLMIVALGLAKGRVGELSRGLGVAGALALVPLGVLVGHSGGDLVYQHGAATAYAGGPQLGSDSERDEGAAVRRERRDDRDDRDDDH